ncbi:hypothetical protein LOK49_LG03G01511 [Camellia lanceoleosa]|uniref:Uncharacterized protein n=1 Tax=Camellia lanceoleosa TaxID=1840588 RepID=A0ACC0ID34_9ERIC|nr:hypothetical protein LOK49_LG03G01511 [Camellia lanceoleosa]
MSGGTPVGGGFMRQRHSQGYTSGSDDLEDDACSRASPQSPSSLQQKTRRRWIEITENVLWIASAVFIIYYGDRHSNFIVILWHDDRIRRIPLYLGMVGVGLNIIFFLYTSMLAWNIRKSGEKWDFSSTSALPFFTFIGVVSFFLFSFALWPIWSFLALPLVFSLFMAGMVLDFVQVIVLCTVVSIYKAGQQAIDKGDVMSSNLWAQNAINESAMWIQFQLVCLVFNFQG